jgi:lysozyme
VNKLRIIATVAAALGIGAGTVSILVDDTVQAEGRRYTAYQDSGGVWTVCDGITGPAVVRGRTYTDAECDDLLIENLIDHCRPVLQGLVDPREGEIIAWCDFAYNAGVGAFQNSTGRRLQNQGERDLSCQQILRWVYVAGKDCRIRANNCYGIVIRRQHQYERCMSDGTVLQSFEVT